MIELSNQKFNTAMA